MTISDQTSLTRVFYGFEEIDFVGILTVIAGAVALTLLVQRLLPRMAEQLPSRFRLRILPVVPILRLAIIVAAVIAVVPMVIRPTPQNFVLIFGALGFALGFAFKDYVSSIIAGVVAIYERPYRPGDWVRIDDVYGEVKSLGLRSLLVLTPNDTYVTIPHAKIWNTSVHNANFGKRDHLCIADFYLDPDHDAEAVRRKLTDVAVTSPYLRMSRRVAVILCERPWGTHYQVKAYPMDNRDEFVFISDLTIRGKAALRAMNVRAARAPMAVHDRTV